MNDLAALTNEPLIHFDWARGQAGTREFDYGAGGIPYEAYIGRIVESWKIPEIGIWIFKIRQGVHFALNPASEASRLVNGRELTADDIVWNVRLYHTDPTYPNSATRVSYPAMAKAVQIDKTGPVEVTLKAPVDTWTAFFWILFGGCAQRIYAPEVVQKYGGITDWRNVVGTGPFMFTDFVSQSVATFKRHPNYYLKDPVGPGKGNQVPYIDTLKYLAVPDLSTRLAVMRTGKADWIADIQSEDARGLIRTNPQLQYKRRLAQAPVIYMRQDKPDLPFKDVRVRQALMMVTDYEALSRDLYRGDAEILTWPVNSAYKGTLYTPMEEQPEAVQALYKHNTEGAKQLLATAGYPNGFKTKMIIQNRSEDLDRAQALKAMWDKAGVDLELQPKETAIYLSINGGVTYEEMYLNTSTTSVVSLVNLFDISPLRTVKYKIMDPVAVKAYDDMQKHIFIDMPGAYEIYRKVVPYVLEKAYVIPLPSAYIYTLWQPWVKNHYGEGASYWISMWTPFVWIDQDIKEQMTGRR